jgi:hypothetical protein
MARPPLPLGQHGEISITLKRGQWAAAAAGVATTASPVRWSEPAAPAPLLARPFRTT